MNIKHNPILKTDKIEKIYSEKDGVPVKYVCTSAINDGTTAMDIFYRETPHPEFGNRYFGIFFHGVSDQAVITNADVIEDLDFGMIDIDGELRYSMHRHDNVVVPSKEGNKQIDGGRAYVRGWGFEMYKVKDGEFVKSKEFVKDEA